MCILQLRKIISRSENLRFYISQFSSFWLNYVFLSKKRLICYAILICLCMAYFTCQVCLQRAGEFLMLNVPGLAEGRPSVLIGDAVILSSPSSPDEPQYEGIVHEVISHVMMMRIKTCKNIALSPGSWVLYILFKSQKKSKPQASSHSHRIDKISSLHCSCLDFGDKGHRLCG